MKKIFFLLPFLLLFFCSPVMAAELDQYWNSGSKDDRLETCDTVLSAQTFTAGQTASIYSVKIRVAKVGTPGDMTLSISTITSGHPDLENILVSKTISTDNTTTTTAGDWEEFIFDTNPTLTASTQYAIILAVPDGTCWTNEIKWLASVTGSYAGGNSSWRYEMSWNQYASSDQFFEEYITFETPENPMATTTDYLFMYSVASSTASTTIEFFLTTDALSFLNNFLLAILFVLFVFGFFALFKIILKLFSIL